MPYRTGSGAYTDMMADILAHAIVDGWTEVGGPASGWPIVNSAGTLWIDWATTTVFESDLTLGGAGGSKTQRRIRYGISTVSAADATAVAPTAEVVTPNAEYTISAWHIFSEPAVSDYIHCCFEFSNGVDPQVYSHMGFGFLDQDGLTHGGVAFAGGNYGRGYAAGTGSGNGAGDWNSLNRCGYAYGGTYGEQDDGFSQLTTMIRSTNHPLPATPGTGGWPNVDTQIGDGNYVWKMNRMGTDYDSTNGVFSGGGNASLNWNACDFQPAPFSGSITMQPMPIFLMNGTASTSALLYVGNIPNMRMCSMNGYAPGDEFSIGADTWKIFPWLCQKADTTLGDQFVVTSGQAGYAYKKDV